MTSGLVTPLSMLICGRIGIEPVVKSSSSSAGISSVGEHAESAAAPMPVSSSRRVMAELAADRGSLAGKWGTRTPDKKRRLASDFLPNMVEKG